MLPKNQYPNTLRILLLFTMSFTLLTCESSSSSTTGESEAAPVDSAFSVVDKVASDELAAVVEATPAVPELSVDFPEDQMITFSSNHLAELCSNQYGCLKEALYPLDWSHDGKFAFMLEEANEAVQNTTIHFRIQNMESDEILEDHTFKASDQPGWSEDTDNYSVSGIWRSQEELYDSLIKKHQIRLGEGTEFSTLMEIETRHGISFAPQDKMRYNSLFDLQEVDQHWLVASKGQQGRKTLIRQTMGQYDLVMASQPLGGFSSPFEARLAIVDGWEKRGYEGPPNVLRLQLVGCDLRVGFE